MTEVDELTPPWRRGAVVAEAALLDEIDRLHRDGALVNGWIIAGPKGIGKATLAYGIARRLLVASASDEAAATQASALVSARSHPDLFVAERRYDEKKERHETEIPVDTIRDLVAFLNRTASFGGWRVAIVDTADDLNRNSANALLKALEEPPARSALFLLSTAPGGLLPTIRSRCRVIRMRPVADERVAAFLEEEGAATGEDAKRIAVAAQGRPGHALALAETDGAAAAKAVERFLNEAGARRDLGALAQDLAGRQADAVYENFVALLLARFADTARRRASEEDGPGAADLVEMRARLAALFARADALNLDRVQTVLAAGRMMSDGRGGR